MLGLWIKREFSLNGFEWSGTHLYVQGKFCLVRNAYQIELLETPVCLWVSPHNLSAFRSISGLRLIRVYSLSRKDDKRRGSRILVRGPGITRSTRNELSILQGWYLLILVARSCAAIPVNWNQFVQNPAQKEHKSWIFSFFQMQRDLHNSKLAKPQGMPAKYWLKFCGVLSEISGALNNWASRLLVPPPLNMDKKRQQRWLQFLIPIYCSKFPHFTQFKSRLMSCTSSKSNTEKRTEERIHPETCLHFLCVSRNCRFFAAENGVAKNTYSPWPGPGSQSGTCAFWTEVEPTRLFWHLNRITDRTSAQAGVEFARVREASRVVCVGKGTRSQSVVVCVGKGTRSQSVLVCVGKYPGGKSQ